MSKVSGTTLAWLRHITLSKPIRIICIIALVAFVLYLANATIFHGFPNDFEHDMDPVLTISEVMKKHQISKTEKVRTNVTSIVTKKHHLSKTQKVDKAVKSIALSLLKPHMVESKVTRKQQLTKTKKVSTAVKSKERPQIAFWAKQYHSIDWKFTELANGDGGCDISFDRNDVEKADAVIFFMKSCNPNDLPPPQSRRKNQVYIWFSHESPWTTFNYYRHKLTEFDNYFNWTMTYRTNSDVVAAMWPTPGMDYLMYRTGRTEDMVDGNLATDPTLSRTKFEAQVKVLMAKKRDLIGWIVSDCRDTNGAVKRMKTVQSLEDAGIKLTKFGKCVHNPLPFNFTIVFQTLSSFKFYIAFENSLHCKDYLTEKTMYNSLVSGTVPVIHGPLKKDVEKILPKGSYIHTEDFQNMKELADFLRHLDNDDSAYMEYFKWWMDPGAQIYPRFGFNFGARYLPRDSTLPQYDKYDVQEDWLEYERFGLYHLCRRLKRGDHINQTHIVKSLADWWYESEPSECRT